MHDAGERAALADVDQIALGPRQGEEPPKCPVKTAAGTSPSKISAVAVGITLRKRGAVITGVASVAVDAAAA